MRVALVAGEASGDLLGAGLIRSLQAHSDNIEFEGVAGPRCRGRAAVLWSRQKCWR
jgi:lipid-A-disaccharide synthase